MKYRSGIAKFQRALERTFNETTKELNTHYETMFDESVWGWPQATERRNGQTVDSPRNLVDKGDLRDSQRREPVDRITIQFTWSVPYAAAVFLGATLKNGFIYPARNLPLHGARDFDWEGTFARKWR